MIRIVSLYQQIIILDHTNLRMGNFLFINTCLDVT